MGKQTRSYNLNPLKLSLATATDVASNLNGGTITEDGSGNLVFTVPAASNGGNGSWQLDEAVVALWRVQDVDGTPGTWENGTFLRSINHWLYEKGSPDTSGESFLGIGICDSTDLSTANGTIYSIGYTGATRVIRTTSIVAGVGTTGTSGAGTMDRIFCNSGQAADAGCWQHTTGGYNGGFTSRVQAAVRNTAVTMIGDQYWFVCAGRLDDTAGAVTLSCTGYALPTNQVVNPE